MIKRILSISILLSLGYTGFNQISTFPWTEDFETQGTCGTFCSSTCALTGDFTNDTGDDQDWLADVAGTTSGSTGPSIDHNPGTSSGIYLYLETSGCTFNTGNLVSPYFDFSGNPIPYVRFWYHMYGATMGTMHFDIDTNGSWINDYIPSWTDDQDVWQEQLVSLIELGGLSNVRFRIRGNTGSSFTSDMAVDDFTVSDTSFSVLSTAQSPLCPSDTNGFISVDGIFGQEPFSYAWSNGSTSANLTGLGEGTYTVTITDDNGNTASETFVFDVQEIIPNQTILGQIACSYDLGTAKVVATGGTPITENYLVDTTTSKFNPDTLQTGTTVTLGDDQVSGDLDIGFDFVFFGDTHSTFNISSNGFISFNGPGADNGCCGGEVIPENSAFEPNNMIALCWDDLYPPGGGTISYYTLGTAPFRTLIVNFTGIPFCCGSTPSVTVQAKLFETSNCIEIHTIDVNNASPATQGIENQFGTEAYVYPGRNGSAWSSEGTFVSFCSPQGGLSYLWPDGVTDTLNSMLTPGAHIVTITDANGCEAYDTVLIDNPISSLSLNPEVFDISCFGFDDGEIMANDTGGIQTVTYLWSNGMMSGNISNLPSGTYSVTATDNIGCVDSVNGLVIEEPELLLTSINNVTSPECPSDSTGSASVSVTGGRVPYAYTWSDGQLTQTATDLIAGTYQVVVEDSSGCQSVQTVNVLSENPAPNVDLGSNVLSTTGIGVTLTAGNHASYLWSTEETTSSILATETGNYWVEVANSLGCVNSDTVYVEIWPNGIEEASGASFIALYPNPTRDVLSIMLNAQNDLSDVHLIVTDVHGKTVLSRNVQSIFPGQAVDLDVNSLAPGFYNLSVNSDEMSIKRSFIKQ
ncbi:MAG: T9SS type A sorting domain-containing protein [Salibacteraceae bacterium]